MCRLYGALESNMGLEIVIRRHIVEVLFNLRLHRKLLRPIGVWSEGVRVEMRRDLSHSARKSERQAKCLLTSQPQPGYEFTDHVPAMQSVFSIISKFLVLYCRTSWTASPRPDMPAPIIRTSISWFILGILMPNFEEERNFKRHH